MLDLDYQIPIIERHQIAAPHNNIPWDSNDVRFHEPLIRIEPYGIAFESYHARTDGKNSPYFRPIEGSHQEGWMRKTVTEKIVAVNAHLRPFGVEIIILDAYRCMECQNGLWKFFYQRGKAENPEFGDKECTDYALGYVRDPRLFDKADSRTFPVHLTGSSIDVTLRDLATGEWLDMGSKFEQIIAISYTDYFERQLAKGEIEKDDVRLLNRRLMDWAFTREGFLNDPILWWHYDWGNQPYVKVQTALYPDDAPKMAWYGPIDAPDWETEDASMLHVEAL